MSRWLALLIAIVGGAVAAYVVTLFAAGALLGILWLYVFGDDPWPEWTAPVLTALIFAGGFAVWAFSSWAIWRQLRARG